MAQYDYEEAKSLIQSICKAAADGTYKTREQFLGVLKDNPSIAAQGYNPYGKIFFWNEASTRLYGYGEQEAVNRDIFEMILPPELRPFARSAVQAAVKSGQMPEGSACDLVHRDGSYVTVFSGHLVFNWNSPSTPEFYCIDVGICAADGR